LVGMYMFTAALPYMVQRTVIENVNSYVFGLTARRAEQSIRIGSFFRNEASSEGGDLLLAAVHGSKFTVEGYTDSFNSIISVMYSMVEIKLFTLPKILLLPGMMMSQPWLVFSVLPASVVLDFGRARVITTLTKRIEKLSRHIQELANRRRKIEQHDAKHEELIRRGAASGFAEGVWRGLASQIEQSTLRYSALTSLRSFINFLYKQDFLGPGIELVLAWLLEARQIMSADIWVYTRVIEDVIDLMLTRFRLDATLATLNTNVDRITDLSTRLANTRARGYASCQVEPAVGAINIGGLHYSRGSSTVQLSQLELLKGRVYAVTGPNGCGKSSLFGILASCGKAGTMLPESMEIHSSEGLVLPSNDIVEITQQLYCPLFVKPVAWMLQEVNMDSLTEDQLQKHIHGIMQLSSELDFRQTDSSKDSQDSAGMTADELQTEADDWFSTLSGGQKGKAEFIRKVFMRDHCPPVLLIDEAFAPLDPQSKALVQRKLKEFCSDSVILVIYHGGASEACVPSEGFFDSSLHFGNGTASLVPVCGS